MDLKHLKPRRSHLLPFAMYMGAFLAAILWTGLAVDRFISSVPTALTWLVPVLTVPAAWMTSRRTIPVLQRYSEKYPASRPLLQPDRSTVMVTAGLVGVGLLAHVLMFWGAQGISHPLVDLAWSLVFSVPLILAAPLGGVQAPTFVLVGAFTFILPLWAGWLVVLGTGINVTARRLFRGTPAHPVYYAVPLVAATLSASLYVIL